MADYLGRHGEVCDKVDGLPLFPQHYTVVPDPDGKTWWCLDKWTPGRTLADLSYSGDRPQHAGTSHVSQGPDRSTANHPGIRRSQPTPPAPGHEPVPLDSSSLLHDVERSQSGVRDHFGDTTLSRDVVRERDEPVRRWLPG